MSDCVFCDIVDGVTPAESVCEWPDPMTGETVALSFRPLNPVTPGHMLVIPTQHVANVGEEPEVSAKVMYAAAHMAAAYECCNIITSQGRDATQSVYHLHLHVVPRRRGDGLKLPWSPDDETGHDRTDE